MTSERQNESYKIFCFGFSASCFTSSGLHCMARRTIQLQLSCACMPFASHKGSSIMRHALRCCFESSSTWKWKPLLRIWHISSLMSMPYRILPHISYTSHSANSCVFTRAEPLNQAEWPVLRKKISNFAHYGSKEQCNTSCVGRHVHLQRPAFSARADGIHPGARLPLARNHRAGRLLHRRHMGPA